MKQKQQRIFEPSLFKQYLRSKMISLLDSIAGKKLLMLDIAVRTPINLIIETKTFSEHGVPEVGGIIPFDANIIDKNYDQIMIFMTPTGQNLKTLKELITMNAQSSNKRYFPCFWPKRTIICKEFLEQEDLLKYVDIKDFSFDLLPLDIDLYSLETKYLKELYINNNHSIYSMVAESIHRLQCVFGKIHNIYGKGKAARAVYEILKLKENEIKIDQNYGDIESIIILDRSIDFLTPLLKQITYEGLTDQFFGINGSIVKVPSALFQENNVTSNKTETAYKILSLNSEKDYIYEQIRSLTINGARTVLKNKGAEIDQFTEEARVLNDLQEKKNATMRINTERDYIKKHLQMNWILMEQMKTISFHKELVLQQKALLEKQSQMIEYFENMIPFEIPLEKVLRSMCLQSIIEKGVHKKVYGKLCEEICFTYGIQHIVSMSNLARLGIFYEEGSIKQNFPFNDIKKQLKLISDAKINHENPQDMSFAYGGYTPIAARLVEQAIRSGWRTIMKGLKMIPGDIIIPEYQKQCTSHPRPAVVVYFVGGVTYGQIATIRLLGKFLKREIVIATTQIINGENFIRQLIQ